MSLSNVPPVPFSARSPASVARWLTRRSLPNQGITATAEVKLVQGPLIVILVTIKEVNAGVILEKLGEKSEVAYAVGSCMLKCLPQEVRAPGVCGHSAHRWKAHLQPSLSF